MDERTKRRISRVGLNLPSRDAVTAAGLAAQGVLADDATGGSPGHTLAQWMAEKFNHNFDSYDQAVDSAYNATHVGGSHYHHLVDGQHSILGAFHAVRDVSADDTWLGELAQAGEHLLRDTASVSGTNPFFSLTPDQFSRLGDLTAQIGISKAFLGDALTVNGPELLGGSLALMGSILLARKAEPDQISRLAGGCAISALASLNPMLMPIAAGSLAYSAYNTGDTRTALVCAGKGGLVSGSAILVSGLVGGPVWLGCVAGMIAGISLNMAIENPDRTFQKAQELVGPVTEVLKQVSGTINNNLAAITA